jgi:hypothetical protein
MISEHLLQSLMIRQFGQRWKCGKGSSPFAKFVHPGPAGDSSGAPTTLRRAGCALPRKNRCDLVTNGWKVRWRRSASPPEETAFVARCKQPPKIGRPEKLVFYQLFTRAGAGVPGAIPTATPDVDEQTHVNRCRFLRLPTAAFRPNDECG